jgi:uncharacterized protein
MHIKQQDDKKNGRFFIEQDGRTLAEMTYVWAGTDRLIIDHTEVDEALQGQGAGKLLLEQLVAFAREQGLKVIPLCPFAKKMFDRTPEYQDLL